MIATWLGMGLSNALMATVLAALVFPFSRRMRPQWAFAVWMLVLVKLLTPPIWNLPLSSVCVLQSATEALPGIDWLRGIGADSVVPSTADSHSPVEIKDLTALHPEITSPPTVVPQPAAPNSLVPWIIPGLLGLWVTGTMAWMILSLRRIRRFRLLLRRARQASPPLREEVRILAERLGLKQVPDVRIARRRISPFVWVLVGRPTILLPAGLLRTLNPPQRTALLLHELAHLRRRDHWTKFVELAAVSVYWWLPTAWWARRHADRAAEHCCDALVVSYAPSASRAYAEALLATIDFLSDTSTPLPLGASGFSQFGYLSRRIEMILEPQPRRRHSLPICLAMVAFAVLALPLSVQRLWAEPASSTAEGTAAPSQQQPSPAIKTRQLDAPIAGDTTAADPTSGELSQGKGNQGAQERELKENRIERELGQIVAETQTSVNLVETNFNRRQAASRQVEAVRAAFEAGTVTLDQLLENERRVAEAKMAYARDVCKLCRDADRRKLLLAEASLNIADESVQQARRTWVQVRKRDHGDRQDRADREDGEEAQAREQYFQFKRQAQQARAEYLELTAGSEKGANGPRASTNDKHEIAKIMGPLIAGKDVPLDPPSDDEVLRAFRRAQASSPMPAGKEDQSPRITKEKIADYVDPPKVYALIGQGQMHHAMYKCTIFSQGPDGKERQDVIFIDHHHILQRKATFSEWELSVQSQITLGQRKQLADARQMKLQLDREKAILGELKTLCAQSADERHARHADRAQLESDVRRSEHRVKMLSMQLDGMKALFRPTSSQQWLGQGNEAFDYFIGSDR